MYKSPYAPPNVSVDIIVLQLIDFRLHVLLIKRRKEPFKDKWALPGGYNPAGETTHEATSRVLKAKGGISTSQLDYIEQLYTFDSIARDPRGHALTVTYLGLGKNLTPVASKTTEHPQFFPIDDLPELAFDHKANIEYALARLHKKILFTNCAFALLPKLFTLSQLQNAYEEVLGKALDKRNFRRKFLKLGMIHSTKEQFMDGAHRPAKLYKFNQQKLESLPTTLLK